MIRRLSVVLVLVLAVCSVAWSVGGPRPPFLSESPTTRMTAAKVADSAIEVSPGKLRPDKKLRKLVPRSATVAGGAQCNQECPSCTAGVKVGGRGGEAVAGGWFGPVTRRGGRTAFEAWGGERRDGATFAWWRSRVDEEGGGRSSG